MSQRIMRLVQPKTAKNRDGKGRGFGIKNWDYFSFADKKIIRMLSNFAH